MLRSFLLSVCCLALGGTLLAAEPAYQMRDGLPAFRKLLASPGEATRVIYFGGDQAAGKGVSKPHLAYKEQVTNWLRKTHKGASLFLFDRAIPGTDSWLGAFRCWEDVGYQRPALVVLDFAPADSSLPDDLALASVEGMVRQLKQKTPSKPDIVFVYSLSKEHLGTYQKGELPVSVQRYEKIAHHYGIPSVFTGRVLAEQITAGKVSADQIDSDAAQASYTETLQAFFTELTSKSIGQVSPIPKEPLVADAMVEARMAPYDWGTLDDGWLGWQLSPSDRIPHVAVSNKPGSTVTVKFKGSQIGLYDIVGPDSGAIEYSVNGSAWQAKDRFDPTQPDVVKPASLLLARGLDPKKEHELKVRVAAQAPAGSKGNVIRLGWFLVDGLIEDPTKKLDPLVRIDTIYAGMKPLVWTPPADRWKNLERTKVRLANGPDISIVLLGDSIMGDTSSSQFEFLLQRAYPKTVVKKSLGLRGSTGCWYYKDENRVEEYVLRHAPNLLMIGGISQKDDIESIRSVIQQCRAKLPELDILLVSPVYGAPHAPTWTDEPNPKWNDYRANLAKLAEDEKCGYFDMTVPWWDYVRTSGYALDSFKRDVVHANARGSQVLGRLLEKFLGP